MARMNQELTTIMHSVLADLPVGSDIRIRSYSGRGMFGDRCLGLVGQSISEIAADLLEAAERTADDEGDLTTNVRAVAKALRASHEDSMGRHVVLYFPEVAAPQTDDQEGDDDCDDEY